MAPEAEGTQHPASQRAVEDPGRRRLVTRATMAVGAAVGAAVAIGPLGMVLDPVLRRRESRGPVGEDGAAAWSVVAPTRRFVSGDPPVRVVLKEDRTDAWLARPGTPVGPVFVQRLDEASFRVFSGICPHLGCSIGFGDSERPYVCPCHRSAFDAAGATLAYADGRTNPAPRGLDPLEWRVAEGVLQDRWVRYETGTADRKPIA